jgi:hypothetical protein
MGKETPPLKLCFPFRYGRPCQSVCAALALAPLPCRYHEEPEVALRAPKKLSCGEPVGGRKNVGVELACETFAMVSSEEDSAVYMLPRPTHLPSTIARASPHDPKVPPVNWPRVSQPSIWVCTL